MWTGVSAVSQRFCRELHEKLHELYPNLRLHYSDLNGEWMVFKTKKTFYQVDFFIEDWKTAIEFHGDFWHANPEKYTADRKIMRLKASTIWAKDKKRTAFLEKKGLKVVIVWESEYNQDPEETVNRILKLIKKGHRRKLNGG